MDDEKRDECECRCRECGVTTPHSVVFDETNRTLKIRCRRCRTLTIYAGPRLVGVEHIIGNVPELIGILTLEPE